MALLLPVVSSVMHWWAHWHPGQRPPPPGVSRDGPLVVPGGRGPGWDHRPAFRRRWCVPDHAGGTLRADPVTTRELAAWPPAEGGRAPGQHLNREFHEHRASGGTPAGTARGAGQGG